VLSAPGLPRRRPSREAVTLQRLNERAWPRVTPAYRALDFRFSVRMAGADLADYVERIFAPFANASPTVLAENDEAAEVAEPVYSVVDDGPRFTNRYALYFDGQPIIRTPFEPLALAFLLWHLNIAVVAASDRYLLVHAAAAAHNGSAILLPAAKDSGKTTLVARLVQRGCGYFTDEATAIDPVTLAVRAYPKPLAVERGSWEVLADLRPDLAERFLPYVRDQWHVVPDSIRPDAIAEPCAPRLIVSPHYEAGARTNLEAISRAQAVLLLAENAFNFESHKADGLHAFANLVTGCECYRLTIGSHDDASDAVMRVVEQLGTSV
jgi:hypothetical protein